MIRVPITVGFNNKHIIGYAEIIDEAVLNDLIPFSRIAFGYTTEDITAPTLRCEVKELSVVPKEKYDAY